MLIEQIIEFQLRGPGPPGRTFTPTIGYFYDKTKIFKENLRVDYYFPEVIVIVICNCNCNYILFTKLPWPGDSERTFRSSSQAATCPPVYHSRRRLHTFPLIAERQAGKLRIPIFIVFGMTRPGIEPKSTASVADALTTRPLIGYSTTDRLSLRGSVTRPLRGGVFEDTF